MICAYKKYPIIIWLAISLLGCVPEKKQEKTLSDYDLNSPEKFFMPESIFEISGIAFDSGNPDTVYAIQDEEGKLFKLGLGVKKQLHSKFGKKGDYEDLTIVNGQVFILKSSGALVSFPLAATYQEEIDSVMEWKQVLPKGEFESLYGDENSGKLYALCKSCPNDEAKESLSGFEFVLGNPEVQTTTFQIDVKEIKEKAGKLKTGFKPSGLAQNPVTGDWYIVSAINKLLVVTDKRWKVKETAPLENGKFNQPEGVAFDKSGNLYISNEGSDISEGNILKFSRLVK